MTGDIIERMRAALRKCATELEAHIGEWAGDNESVKCARAVLAEAEKLGPAELMLEWRTIRESPNSMVLVIPILDQPKEPTR